MCAVGFCHKHFSRSVSVLLETAHSKHQRIFRVQKQSLALRVVRFVSFQSRNYISTIIYIYIYIYVQLPVYKIAVINTTHINKKIHKWCNSMHKNKKKQTARSAASPKWNLRSTHINKPSNQKQQQRINLPFPLFDYYNIHKVPHLN